MMDPNKTKKVKNETVANEGIRYATKYIIMVILAKRPEGSPLVKWLILIL